MSSDEPTTSGFQVRLHDVVRGPEQVDVSVQVVTPGGRIAGTVVVHAALDDVVAIESQTSRDAARYGLAREAAGLALVEFEPVSREGVRSMSFPAVPQQVLAWARQAPITGPDIGDVILTFDVQHPD
jgi:hypothetical protein